MPKRNSLFTQGVAESPASQRARREGQLNAALDAARAAADARGVTLAIVRDGEVEWAGASGVTLDGATPMSADAPMVIGSATKTFVAAAVLQLAAERGLNLDDRAADHLPELGALIGSISVRQLLDHSSGLADLFNETTRRALETQPGRAWAAAEILATLRPAWHEPGEGWAYANTNYYLLGMLVERLTGAPLADELDRRFLAPLGLTATRVLSAGDGGPLPPAWATIFWASGAMASSAADLARWGDALYRGGVLDVRLTAEMTEINGHDYGLGVQRIELPGPDGHGHTGLLMTNTTLLLHLPHHGVTLAMLVNRTRVDLAAMLTTRPDGGPSLLDVARAAAD